MYKIEIVSERGDDTLEFATATDMKKALRETCLGNTQEGLKPKWVFGPDGNFISNKDIDSLDLVENKAYQAVDPLAGG